MQPDEYCWSPTHALRLQLVSIEGAPYRATQGNSLHVTSCFRSRSATPGCGSTHGRDTFKTLTYPRGVRYRPGVGKLICKTGLARSAQVDEQMRVEL